MAETHDVRVVHQDDALLVLDKPPGIATTAPDGGHCLVDEARALDPGAPHLHASSRLDAEVSGLVTFARTREANRGLLEAREQGRYHRVYLALCVRPPEPREGSFSWALGIDPRDKRRRVTLEEHPGAHSGRDAVTRYRTLAATDRAALLWLEPQTGRTHQLRVHAEHADCPLLGDRHYGGPRRIVLGDGRVVGLRRVMLHCTRLSLPDMRGAGGLLNLESLPRDDFLQAWEALGGAPLSQCLPER